MSNPWFNTCCKDGDVVLPDVGDAPPDLQDLYTNNHPGLAQFLKNIHHYNSAVAFTSCCYNVDPHLPGHSIHPFQIQGQLYHQQGPLDVVDGEPALFAQVWIHDLDFGDGWQCGHDQNINPQVFTLL